MIAVAALVIVPVAALSPKFGGAIAPLGASLVIGAFTFGIGMQLANGCGSGTLYTAGGGSGRMLLALAGFIVGCVAGSLSLPAFLALGGVDPIIASDYLGPWGGLAATLGSLALAAAVIVAVAKRRGADFRPSRNYVVGGCVIGLLCVAVFIAGGHPGASPSALRCGAPRPRARSASTSPTRHSGNGRAPSTHLQARCWPTPRA